MSFRIQDLPITKKWTRDSGDPSAVFWVGRSVRDKLLAECGVRTIEDLLALVPAEVMAQKKRDGGLERISEKTIEIMQRRARVLTVTKAPEIRGDIVFPNVRYELFFDIEDDPTREFVYMHGVYERANGQERYLDFTAQEIGDVAEKAAWQRFWSYIRSLPKGEFAVYYYSHHERTTYRRLRRKYPDVVSEDELEAFFVPPNAIDLYTDIVLKQTDWPVWSYSIKEIAQYLGFRWRDQTPSGALSIQWFNEYITKKDPAILTRILEYNEDDCKATMVLKDGIERLAAV